MMKTVLKFAMAAALAGLAGTAQAEGDAAAGAKVFNKCKACHVVDKEQNRVGPYLKGIIGRPVATVEGFKYSKAMIEWGAGKTWTEEQLTTYLADPKGMVKGTKMAFAGLKKDQEIADVIAYLKGAGS